MFKIFFIFEMVEICYPYGIGDLIILKQYSLKNNINIEKILINKSLLKYRLNGDNYFKFVKKFINNLFKNCEIILLENEKKTVEIKNIHNSLKIYNLYDLYNFKHNYENTLINNKKYIIIHTKFRFDNKKNSDLFIENIMPILKNFFNNLRTKYKIIIAGEKEAEKNYENNILNVQTIYNLLENLKQENDVIDITSNMISSNNDINNFENELHIINKASANITFGHGGSYVMCNSFCDKNFCFIGNIKNYMPPEYEKISYRNLDIFLNELDIFLKD